MKDTIWKYLILSFLCVIVEIGSQKSDYLYQEDYYYSDLERNYNGDLNKDYNSDIEYYDSDLENENGEYDEEIEEDEYLPIGLKNYVDGHFNSFTKDEEMYYERVNQGQIANSGQFPFQAGLQIRRDGKQKYWCGGALINAEWILTAAHCLDRASNIKLILGAQDRKNKEESGRIKRLIITENTYPHEGWNRETLEHDIALIRLDPPVEFNERIGPIGLPEMDDMFEDFAGKEAWITGWGRYFKKCKKLSPSLRYAVGRILTNEECIENYGDRIFESHICFNGTERQGVCRGDSGGPLFTKNSNGKPILLGLASFGRGCGSRAPGVFSRVTYYLKWIESITDIPFEMKDDVKTEINWKDLDPFK